MARRKRGKFSRFHKKPFLNEIRPASQATINREVVRIRRENESQEPQSAQVEGMALGLRRPVVADQRGMFDALSRTEEKPEERKLDLSDLIA